MIAVTQGALRRECSVIIPTWQRAFALRETLDSLAQQTFSNFEVIVVSDGEDPATRSLAGEYRAPFPMKWIFHEQNQGQAASRNTGVARAQGDIVLFLDDDTPADPTLIAQHISHFVDPQCRIAVYGNVLEDRQADLPLWTDKFMQKSWEQSLEAIRNRIAATGADSVGDTLEQALNFGLNASIRRNEFLVSGGFNPKLRYQEEDMELGLRLYRSGVRFQMDPLAVVHHRNSKPMGEYFRRAWYLGGHTDVMRVLEFGQRNPQTRQLANLCSGRLLGRMLSKSFYYASPLWRGVTSVLESATNRTGSRILFGAWARLSRPSEYWRGAKDAGFEPSKLKDLIGESGCALMFHSLSVPQTPEERTYYLNPQRFRRYVHWMKELGYESANPDDWVKGHFAKKRILLTFDDGYDDLYTELLPLATEYHLKPLVFLVANRSYATNVWDHTRGLRQRNLLTVEQIREMQRHGVVFGSHTVTHPWLPDTTDDDLRCEVRDSKHVLEDILGTEVTSFAYPFGGVDQRVRGAVAEAGYQMAFTARPGVNWWNDPLCLKRGDINENTSFLDFMVNLRTGHSALTALAARAKSLEQELPTHALRSFVGGTRGAVRSIFLKSHNPAPPRKP